MEGKPKPRKEDSPRNDHDCITEKRIVFRSCSSSDKDRLERKKNKRHWDLGPPADDHQPELLASLLPSKGCKRRRSARYVHEEEDEDDAVVSTVERALEVQANLEAKFPSFIKTMVPSNIQRGFLLKLPKDFCLSHLPRYDATILLLDEDGVEYRTNFLVERLALSGGWRRFAKTNKIAVGDVLVFQLVGHLKFQVYTVKEKKLSVIDGALALMHLDDITQQANPQIHSRPKPLKCIASATGNGSIAMNEERMVCDGEPIHLTDQPETDTGNIGSSSSKGIVRSTSDVELRDVQDLGDFSALVCGADVNSELHNHLWAKYYELCCTQKSCLHTNLLKTIGKKLAVEMIAETIKIADGIKGCKGISLAKYENWDRTLQAFQLLGMNVAFLHAQLKRLKSLKP